MIPDSDLADLAFRFRYYFDGFFQSTYTLEVLSLVSFLVFSMIQRRHDKKASRILLSNEILYIRIESNKATVTAPSDADRTSEEYLAKAPLL